MGSLLGQQNKQHEFLGRLDTQLYEYSDIEESAPTITRIRDTSTDTSSGSTMETTLKPIRYREPTRESDPTRTTTVSRDYDPILTVNDPEPDPSDGSRSNSGSSEPTGNGSPTTTAGQTNFKAIGQNVIDRMNNDLIPYLKSIPPTYYAIGGGVMLAVILLRR